MVILSERKMHVVILTVEFIRSLLHQGTCSVKHNTNDGHCSLFDLGKKATVSCVYQQLVTSTQEKVKVHQRVKQKNTSEYLCITELVYSCLRHSIFTNISPKNHNPSLTLALKCLCCLHPLTDWCGHKPWSSLQLQHTVFIPSKKCTLRQRLCCSAQRNYENKLLVKKFEVTKLTKVHKVSL